MRKEVALFYLKLLLTYENPDYEETFDMEVESQEDALGICEAFMAEQDKRTREMESRNVYCSRRLLSCKVVGQA